MSYLFYNLINDFFVKISTKLSAKMLKLFSLNKKNYLSFNYKYVLLQYKNILDCYFYTAQKTILVN